MYQQFGYCTFLNCQYEHEGHGSVCRRRRRNSVINVSFLAKNIFERNYNEVTTEALVVQEEGPPANEEAEEPETAGVARL